MQSRKFKFIQPADEPLYPIRKDGVIQTLINPNTETALTQDVDSQSNFIYNRYRKLPFEAQRQKLPIFQYRNHILYLLEKYQTLVLIGETGCGKSTQVPQYLNEIGHNVCVTQPRVTAAVTLATRVAEERGVQLGDGVGYSASMMSMRSPDTSIVFMTEGVLLREMFASPLLMQYSCIVLDEVHERSQMTDVLMGLLKKIIKKRKNLKLVISSATMDADFLKDFFNISNDKEKSTSVVMSVQGRVHPIDLYYTEEPVADYVKATVDTVIKIHENEPFGDILAFLTSQEEIHLALETLEVYAEANNEKNKFRKHFPSGVKAANMEVMPFYGSLAHHRQCRVFQSSELNVRKVILATNIAETSVTVPHVVYVIDCGYHKVPFLDPAVGVECLSVCPLSKRNATQRAGRAGRTSRGKCFRLYTEAEYEKLPESVPPEMCRSDLSSVLLQLKALGIHNLLKFTFPTPPPAKSLLYGLESLVALAAIERDGLASATGAVMAELPLKPMLAKMLCNGGKYGCLEEALSIVSMLHVDGVLVKPSGGKANIAARVARRNHFEVAEGDIIMYLNIYDAYNKVKKSSDNEKSAMKSSKAWCQRMFINHRVMEKAVEIRRSLEKMADKFRMENETCEEGVGDDKCLRVMKCVVSGIFKQSAYLHLDGSYRTILGTELHISPDSCLYHQQQPKWVVFASVQSASDKTYMRDVMAIDKNWLLEVAPHYYKEM